MIEIGADAVHLVDKGNARDAIFVGLAPYGFGLGLDASHRVEHGHRTIQYSQRAFHFYRKVHVARRIDNVDAVHLVEPLPGSSGGRGRNRDSALALLLHPVHRGSAFVDFADLISHTRIEQDALGDGGLTGIDMRHDPDVAGLIELYLSCHFLKAIQSVFSYQR